MPLQQVAKVLKSNGTDGGLLVGFRDIDPNEISLAEPVFIEFDGLPVPFFIESFQTRGNAKALVHLTGIHSLEDAEEVVGQPVWAEWEEDASTDEDFSDLVGWTVAGAGRVTDFVDIPANPCLEIETKNGTKVLVPFHEDLILSADPEARVLEMDIPDGLLDL